MGLLVDGVWHDRWYDTKSTGGRFQRQDAQFRNWVTADGSAGPSGTEGFQAEPGRYHLYASPACPWTHRTLIFRALKGLEDAISVNVLSPNMLDQGWVFDATVEGADADEINGKTRLYEVYQEADANYSGRVTVPVLWDKQRHTIVSNESCEIMRMLNSAFDGVGAKPGDFYPEPLRDAIDEINARIYECVNNGVYRCGFATTQEAYEEAFHALFVTLDALEELLDDQRYLVGGQITEADWRLFATLVRFDPVYYSHFKCNLRMIADYPNLSNYLRELFQVPGVAETVNFDHIKQHYYFSQRTINPTGVVPIGPLFDYTQPHDRERLAG